MMPAKHPQNARATGNGNPGTPARPAGAARVALGGEAPTKAKQEKFPTTTEQISPPSSKYGYKNTNQSWDSILLSQNRITD